MGPVAISRDIAGGLLLTSIGSFAAAYSVQYDLGTLRQMGTGMFPFCLAVLLTIVGVVLIVLAVVGPARNVSDNIQVAPRDVLCVLLAIIAYGITVERAGLVVATLISVALCSIPCRMSWAGRVALGSGVSVVCYAIFIFGLGMTIPVWPWST